MVMALALLLTLGGPAPFTLVNGTDAPLAGLAAQPVGGEGRGRPLGVQRLSPGARVNLPALGGETCAFAIEAEGGGGRLRWSDVNLCDVKIVTLRQRGATLWVDYD